MRLGTITKRPRTLEEVEALERAELLREVRAERVRKARATAHWTEVPDDFVPRLGGRLLVSASSDVVYKPARGVVFAEASTNLVDEVRPLSFVVRDDNELSFYEKQPETWSAMLARRGRKASRRQPRVLRGER
jgi:hypothetical protein